jgi:GxxExxY protein
MTENEISKVVVDAAIQVHRNLGPGLFESVYEVVLSNELKKRGLRIERQVSIPIEYDGLQFNEGRNCESC